MCSCIAAAAAATPLHAGEVGIAGPGPAQAVVAGHSTGFLLLVLLRVVTKLALPATRKGTRISVSIYFSATGLLVLSALFAYLFVLRPAVQAAASDRLESRWALQCQISMASTGRRAPQQQVLSAQYIGCAVVHNTS
jgi:hypothetical protein